MAYKWMNDVTTVVGTGAAHNMALVGIQRFDKDRLAHVDSVEKNVLPDAKTIQEEKEMMEKTS